MRISSLSTSLAHSGSDCLTVFVNHNGQILGSAAELDAALVEKLEQVSSSGLLGSQAGNQLVLPLETSSPNAVLLYRLGKETISVDKYQESITKLASSILGVKTASIAIDLTPMDATDKDADQLVFDLCTALHKLSYRFEDYKSKKKPKRTLEEILVGHADANEAVDQANATAAGIALARDLGNMPGNFCTPNYLAERAESLSNDCLLYTSDAADE